MSLNQGVDPRTGEPVGDPVPDTRAEQVRSVAQRAADCAPRLAGLPYAGRGQLLNALATALRQNENELVELADRETALGSPRLPGELARTAAQLDMFADVLRDGAFCEAVIDRPDANAVPPHGDLRRMLVPLGPVAVFAAGNFPFAFSVLGGDTASALAAGCPVVVKAHPGHPGLSERIADLAAGALSEAGAPDGTLSVVHGYEAGPALVTDPSITAVGFTGSTGGGRALYDLAVGRENPIPFYGELGSINPVVVTGSAVDARGREIAEGLAGSFRLGTGQFCTKPGVVFVPADSGFDSQAADAVRPSAPAPMLTARMRDAFQSGVAALSEVPGVRELVKAEPLDADGHDVLPAVLAVDAETFASRADALAGECFGPVTVLVEYRDTDSLHRALRTVPGSLTGSLHAEPGDPTAGDIVGVLRESVGRIIVNGWPTGVAVTWSQHHGGPWPATTDPLHTSVGATAIRRFLRPVTYQDVPDELLPEELRDGNPLGIPRRVDGVPA
ncbi:aldehyde dehydrogenase (NADP(+)) [Prauserella alba]|uniref:Aldehyde dehydrogenase (NADP(+)) n=1 Tax=Prauserella alba TaxID=176898 RepID=A0ABN1V728_9PSEU|nr:aldehyde dehydrogenase (NADP(+)) [Prauserella alba]MCP2181287.1 NADP-dependent aldehyde dehydrogenase [Prauserella alba]